MQYTVETLPSHLLQCHHVPLGWNQRLVSVLPLYCTVVLCCYSCTCPIWGRGNLWFLPSMRIASEIQSWGEGPTSRESPYRLSCNFEALAKQSHLLQCHHIPLAWNQRLFSSPVFSTKCTVVMGCYSCTCFIWGHVNPWFLPSMRVATEIQSWGGRVQHWGRVPIVSAAISKRSQNKKKILLLKVV